MTEPPAPEASELEISEALQDLLARAIHATTVCLEQEPAVSFVLWRDGEEVRVEATEGLGAQDAVLEALRARGRAAGDTTSMFVQVATAASEPGLAQPDLLVLHCAERGADRALVLVQPLSPDAETGAPKAEGLLQLGPSLPNDFW